MIALDDLEKRPLVHDVLELVERFLVRRTARPDTLEAGDLSEPCPVVVLLQVGAPNGELCILEHRIRRDHVLEHVALVPAPASCPRDIGGDRRHGPSPPLFIRSGAFTARTFCDCRTYMG